MLEILEVVFLGLGFLFLMQISGGIIQLKDEIETQNSILMKIVEDDNE